MNRGPMSSHLKVRNIDWQFPDDVRWNWNPGNPSWGNVGHYIGFMAPGFERYFIKSIRKAIPLMRDPAIAEEADLFCKQEGLHAKHHQSLVAVLCKQYPGLKPVTDEITGEYDALFEKETLEFHLAYAAVVEATFSPLAKFVAGNRQCLFRDTDPRIASFIMWHLMEEYEHRSSALNIYNHVVGSYWYRLRKAPQVVKHLMHCVDIIERGCNAAVPAADMGMVMDRHKPLYLEEIPLKNKLSTLFDLFCTLFPFHNPDHVEQPEWVRQWFEAESSGIDMRTYFPNVSP